jgi:pyruvate formate lyase activating enzyme
MKGLISSIQRYSLRDGPGIRSTVFMMGCNLHCQWCSNPELISDRPKVMVFTNKCTGCGACLMIDTDHALTLDKTTLSFDPTKDLTPFIAVCPAKVFVLVGETIEASELARLLLRDRLFYEKSGGGVTFSGGEPMLQSEFILETAHLLKSEGISIAIDTAGNVDYASFETLNPVVDEYLYDLKIIEAARHEHYTGVNNRLILENLQKLIDDHKTVILRMVIIPGINDRPEDFLSRIETLSHYQNKIKRIDLLGYHRLGEGKYRALGQAYLLNDSVAFNMESTKTFIDRQTEMGFDVHLEQAT